MHWHWALLVIRWWPSTTHFKLNDFLHPSGGFFTSSCKNLPLHTSKIFLLLVCPSNPPFAAHSLKPLQQQWQQLALSPLLSLQSTIMSASSRRGPHVSSAPPPSAASRNQHRTSTNTHIHCNQSFNSQQFQLQDQFKMLIKILMAYAIIILWAVSRLISIIMFNSNLPYYFHCLTSGIWHFFHKIYWCYVVVNIPNE